MNEEQINALLALLDRIATALEGGIAQAVATAERVRKEAKR